MIGSLNDPGCVIKKRVCALLDRMCVEVLRSSTVALKPLAVAARNKGEGMIYLKEGMKVWSGLVEGEQLSLKKS